MVSTFARHATRLLLFARLGTAAALLAGCDSDAHRVCSDMTNCSHGGSDDYATACRDQVDDLSHEATRSGCDTNYDAYFSCAEDHFECTGNRATFPGCEAPADALDRCLDAGRANNACGELETRLAACAGTSAGAANDGPPSLQPCTAHGVCLARCYLDSLADVCAPAPAELYAFSFCALSCEFSDF
jgi:hypothetical protein